MPYFEAPDVSLFYTSEGDGPPVLMVHGWSCDGADWSWQVPAFRAAGFRCIVPDLRVTAVPPSPPAGIRRAATPPTSRPSFATSMPAR